MSEDDGSRPFPPEAEVVNWACSSILIDDAPYDGALLTPGKAYQLSAIVSNTGALKGTVTVRFYPSEPATGLDYKALLPGAQPFPVPPSAVPGEKTKSPPQTFVPSFSQPSHICLFAEATTPGDFANGSGDALHDRHYAVRNIFLHSARPGQRFVIPFSAVGTPRADTYVIGVRQVVSDLEHAETLTFPTGALQIIDPELAEDAGDQLRVDLRSQESRPLQALVTMPEEAMPGASAQLVIEQTPLEEEQDAPTGAIGITIHVED